MAEIRFRKLRRRHHGGWTKLVRCQPALLLGPAAIRLHPGDDPPEGGRHGQNGMDPRHRWETFWKRFGVFCDPFQPSVLTLQRRTALQNWSLLGQGDGAKFDDHQIREPTFRAHLEPWQHCLRCHHIQGAVWNSGSRRLLWRIRYHSWHHAEPSFANPVLGCHGKTCFNQVTDFSCLLTF